MDQTLHLAFFTNLNLRVRQFDIERIDLFVGVGNCRQNEISLLRSSGMSLFYRVRVDY